MRIINRKNIIGIVGISYTLVSLLIIFSEIILDGSNATHYNLLMGLVFTIVTITILSLHYLLDNFSPLVMMVIQLVIGIIIVLMVTYLVGQFEELHPHAYIDMVRSFASVYIIAGIYYYIHLYREIKKQNRVIEDIQKHNI